MDRQCGYWKQETGGTRFSAVYFLNESEPYMTIAVPEPLAGRRRRGVRST